jgi:hypothetical protein
MRRPGAGARRRALLAGVLHGKATEFREYQGDEQREDRFWS